MAKLHVICGNCGNADITAFEYRVEKDLIDFGGKQYADTVISCENCGTLHVLSDVFQKLPTKSDV